MNPANRPWRLGFLSSLILIPFNLAGCGDPPPNPGASRPEQLGDVTVALRSGGFELVGSLMMKSHRSGIERLESLDGAQKRFSLPVGVYDVSLQGNYRLLQDGKDRTLEVVSVRVDPLRLVVDATQLTRLTIELKLRNGATVVLDHGASTDVVLAVSGLCDQCRPEQVCLATESFETSCATRCEADNDCQPHQVCSLAYGVAPDGSPPTPLSVCQDAYRALVNNIVGDPRILTLQHRSLDREIEIYGSRDAEGAPSAVSASLVRDGDTEYYVTFAPWRLYAVDGVVDLPSAIEASARAVTTASKQAPNKSFMDVHVTTCQQPEDNASVFVDVGVSPNDPNSRKFPAAFIGNGTYRAQLPSDQQRVGDLAKDTCNLALSLVTDKCSYLSLLEHACEDAPPSHACSALPAIELALYNCHEPSDGPDEFEICASAAELAESALPAQVSVQAQANVVSVGPPGAPPMQASSPYQSVLLGQYPDMDLELPCCRDCSSPGVECGVLDTGCGTTLDCGSCSAGTCGAVTPNRCDAPQCPQVGSMTITYRQAAAGCPPSDSSYPYGNPFFCQSDGPVAVDLEPGKYRLRVTGVGSAGANFVLRAWLGDASGGSSVALPQAIDSAVEVQVGQHPLYLYSWDWIPEDNPSSYSTTFAIEGPCP